MGNNAEAFQDYQTPPTLFAEWDQRFDFTLDAAASASNALCLKFYTKEDDGLSKDWGRNVVWCNPPYARWQLFRWVEKAHTASTHGATVVMLIPSSVETEWFHYYVWDKETRRERPFVELHLLPFRPRFIDPRNKAKSYKGWRPLTSCMVVVFHPQV